MAQAQRSLGRNIYAVGVAVVGYGAVAVDLILRRPSDNQWLLVGVLVALAMILGGLGARLPRGTPYVGLEGTPYYAAVLMLAPGASGLVCILPFLRWRLTTPGATNWMFLRNSGMYGLMGYLGAQVYQAARGQTPLAYITLGNLLAIVPAFLVIRVLNEGILFGTNALAQGVRPALTRLREGQRAGWVIQGLAYLPAILTSLVWSRIDWQGWVIWLALLTAGAFALYQLVRARSEITGRLQELSAANLRMTEHEKRETVLAQQLGQASEQLSGYASRLAAVLQQQHVAVTEITATVEELAQQARYIADAAGAVDSTSEAALVTAGRGQAAAAASAQAMEALEHNVREISTRMSTLEARSRLIHRTLQTINNI